jgi:hypothetical protein
LVNTIGVAPNWLMPAQHNTDPPPICLFEKIRGSFLRSLQ